ncbi:exocyst complex component 6B-like [Thalassophryne amazonica]|uniref:exocyst complex component 6B-like n=1 Tax=Thalassophryne amazonica TaxID=390379 RepID=UPI0014709B27|nr:exocyst complex component 6B-like [Thalassophryne amazonica]
MANVETAAEHERILREIESTDTNCIGPTLRSVYDGQEHGLFMEKLDARIRNHDREIEKMCNHHFQGFVDSITELLKVRGEAQKLKSQVIETNGRLQEDGKELISSMEELKQCRLQQRNIATIIDKLTHCLPVLEMYSRLQEQMKAKRYYPALKTLEQLEQTCLPKAGQYRFCSIMSENIPRLRIRIRDTAMTQLRDFLESIRKHSDKIGETAIKQAQLQRSLDSSVSAQPRTVSGRRNRKEAATAAEGMENSGEGRSPFLDQDSGILDVEDEDDDDVTGAQDLVDFSPVYHCLHIYTVLHLTGSVPSVSHTRLSLVLSFSSSSWLEPETLPVRTGRKCCCSLIDHRLFYLCVLSSTEVDDMIRKSTNLLLTRTLSHCLQYAIKKKNVGLAELVQVIINTTHLEQSCHFLEEFISNITNVPPDTANATKLYGTSTFKDARHAAEAEIYTSLNAKIDQFLQLADYDWTAPVQGSGNLTPSDYLSDLIAFLRSTFSVFTNLPGMAIEHATLPGKVAQTACMSACKHISTLLMQLLLDPEVRQISMGALHQLNTDVKECESFARAGPVAGFQGDTLLLAFSDLRQLLDLFTQWDWSTYLADYGKPACRYLRVNPHTALALLEKLCEQMREMGRKNNVFAPFRKQDRDRQKLIDTVLKQLRNLIAQHHASKAHLTC